MKLGILAIADVIDEGNFAPQVIEVAVAAVQEDPKCFFARGRIPRRLRRGGASEKDRQQEYARRTKCSRSDWKSSAAQMVLADGYGPWRSVRGGWLAVAAICNCPTFSAPPRSWPVRDLRS
jgi:hypothetical protein